MVARVMGSVHEDSGTALGVSSSSLVRQQGAPVTRLHLEVREQHTPLTSVIVRVSGVTLDSNQIPQKILLNHTKDNDPAWGVWLTLRWAELL